MYEMKIDSILSKISHCKRGVYLYDPYSASSLSKSVSIFLTTRKTSHVTRTDRSLQEHANISQYHANHITLIISGHHHS